jgi:hypothetical protein
VLVQPQTSGCESPVAGRLQQGGPPLSLLLLLLLLLWADQLLLLLHLYVPLLLVHSPATHPG